MGLNLEHNTYQDLILTLKQEIKQTRIRAHLAINRELILLYWNIGKHIVERQQNEGWGTKVNVNISKDLRKEFPEMKGLSTRNLVYMQTFDKNYPDPNFTQEVLAQINLYHNLNSQKNYLRNLRFSPNR